MRRHSRWAVAAVTASLTLVLASPGSARIHRRAHGDTPPATTTSPAQMPQTPPSPSSGMRSNDEPAVPQPEVADAGKGGMSNAAIDPHDVEAILGKNVRSSAGEDMGRLVDVVVDRDGRPRAAIIDFGGFLGVGSRKIAVDWGALHFPPPGKPGARIALDLNRDQVNAAPEYQEGKPVVVLGALGKLEPLPE